MKYFYDELLFKAKPRNTSLSHTAFWYCLKYCSLLTRSEKQKTKYRARLQFRKTRFAVKDSS